jgi:hypothetical protein
VFFAWLAALGKFLTMDNLTKQHVIVVYWYYMCKKSGKSSGKSLCLLEMTFW